MPPHPIPLPRWGEGALLVNIFLLNLKQLPLHQSTEALEVDTEIEILFLSQNNPKETLSPTKGEGWGEGFTYSAKISPKTTPSPSKGEGWGEGFKSQYITTKLHRHNKANIFVFL